MHANNDRDSRQANQAAGTPTCRTDASGHSADEGNDDEAAEGGAEAGNDSAESTSERKQQENAGDAAEDGNEEQQGEDESASGKVSSGQGDPKAATADSEGQAKPKDVAVRDIAWVGATGGAEYLPQCFLDARREAAFSFSSEETWM